MGRNTHFHSPIFPIFPELEDIPHSSLCKKSAHRTHRRKNRDFCQSPTLTATAASADAWVHDTDKTIGGLQCAKASAERQPTSNCRRSSANRRQLTITCGRVSAHFRRLSASRSFKRGWRGLERHNPRASPEVVFQHESPPPPLDDRVGTPRTINRGPARQTRWTAWTQAFAIGPNTRAQEMPENCGKLREFAVGNPPLYPVGPDWGHRQTASSRPFVRGLPAAAKCIQSVGIAEAEITSGERDGSGKGGPNLYPNPSKCLCQL